MNKKTIILLILSFQTILLASCISDNSNSKTLSGSVVNKKITENARVSQSFSGKITHSRKSVTNNAIAKFYEFSTLPENEQLKFDCNKLKVGISNAQVRRCDNIKRSLTKHQDINIPHK